MDSGENPSPVLLSKMSPGCQRSVKVDLPGGGCPIPVREYAIAAIADYIAAFSGVRALLELRVNHMIRMYRMVAFRNA